MRRLDGRIPAVLTEADRYNVYPRGFARSLTGQPRPIIDRTGTAIRGMAAAWLRRSVSSAAVSPRRWLRPHHLFTRPNAIRSNAIVISTETRGGVARPVTRPGNPGPAQFSISSCPTQLDAAAAQLERLWRGMVGLA